jgi:hypothetical protein
MQSIGWTGRLLSRALWNGITNCSSNSSEANLIQQRKREPHFLSVVCGFPKDFAQSKQKKGQFGDDAWFSAKIKSSDVLGRKLLQFVGIIVCYIMFVIIKFILLSFKLFCIFIM